NGQVLYRLQVDRDPVHSGQRRSQTRHHVAHALAALGERLERDLDATAVQGRVGAVDTDERRDAGYGRVFQDLAPERLLALGHRVERDVLRRLGDAEDHARILDREQAL